MKNVKQMAAIRKRLSALLLSAVMLIGMLTVGAFAAQDVTDITAQLCPHFNIVVDGTTQTFYDALGREVHPIVYNSSTYLPIRAIGELMGKNVNWDQSALTATLGGTRTTPKIVGTPDNTAVQMNISAQLRQDFTIVVDGSKRSFVDVTGAAVYPLLYNGSIYLPVRAIGELMGRTVDWDGATNTVTLTTSTGSLVTDADSFSQNSGTATSSVKPDEINSAMISADTAKAKALVHAGLTTDQVTFVKSKLDYENGRQVYDVEFYTSDRQEYDYEIDAYTGEVISYDYDAKHNNNIPATSTAGSYIGEDEARNIALAKVPGATASNVTKLQLDYENGRYEYEVEIIYNAVEYDFEIDAYSGTILSQESEPVHR